MGLPARLVEALLPERLRDLEVDVDPTRSTSSNGPIRKPPPTRMMRSIWSWEEIRWPSSRSASSMNGRATRLATNPIRSAARIGSRLIARATSVAVASVSSDVSSPATISTRRIRGGGLKKCIPQTRSGRSIPAAIAVTDREEVLVARIASGPQTSSSLANRLRFSSRSSGAASITSSQSARSSGAARLAEPRGRRLCRARAPATSLGSLGRAPRAVAGAGGQSGSGPGRGGRSRTGPGRPAGRCRRPSSRPPLRRFGRCSRRRPMFDRGHGVIIPSRCAGALARPSSAR